MGIGPGDDCGLLNASYDKVEDEKDILHRLALESKEQAIKIALNELHVLVRLYHADEIAEEHAENRRISEGIENRLERLVNQSK